VAISKSETDADFEYKGKSPFISSVAVQPLQSSVATARLESRKSIKSSRNGVSRSRGYGSRLLMTKPRLSCGLDPKKETISIFQYSEDLRLSGHIKCAL
jgi:hypothetical protein